MALETLSWKKGCHCGAVAFEVLASDDIEVSDCNCLICAKSGFLHLIVPKDYFRLICGEDALTRYQFNTQTAKHMFLPCLWDQVLLCTALASRRLFGNARCLDPDSIRSMRVKPFDGRNWERTMAGAARLEKV